ncbi:MAG: Glycosyl transferase, family 2 (Modular protein) [Candidatus Gottesmanbacteria bacterium GW2011_GWA1_43_11]|uniref:Glycosyl transferase, family 2 (Modular protein) n=1 Tax=Candidatus Gottesmanbacteria bacterium GW2011_GWA1_43_11 TaxID=1618436 RepID=A0A0G1FF12_9BACT|nr:MAG: Glycosyl transferase, family 2 (Modular protein) [Candidatus Gottesmanbacteria bacterium GW2011_GWA1_43_11]
MDRLTARGDILLVLNADDALMPYACSWAVKEMAKHKEAAVVYGDQYLINEKGAITGIGVTGPFDFVKFLCIEQYMATQAAFIRRSCFESVGMWVDQSLETMPDYELWLRIAARYPMQYASKAVTKYRIYPHWDGKHPRTARRFIKAKSTVLERWLTDPAKPYLQTLRKRAYAGLYLWIAEEILNLGNYKDYALYSILSLLTYPKRSTIMRLRTVFYEKLWRKWQQKNL